MIAARLAALGPRATAVLHNKRFFSIHEHQSMELLGKYSIPVPRWHLARTVGEARSAAESLGGSVVIKAQVLAGGRGKGKFVGAPHDFGGGVHVARSADSAAQIAEQMIGRSLVTKQTGASGKPCSSVLVAEKVAFTHEHYLAVTLDRESGGARIIGSSRGGMDIEAVAREDPRAISSIAGIAPGKTPDESELCALAAKMNIPKESLGSAAEIMRAMLRLMHEMDATLIEVNPLVSTADGRLLCLDAKLNFDDNAAFRQRKLFALRDTTQEDPREVDAARHDLNYIGLDGQIGCLVNGAGLAMATMDIVKLHGGEPANFLDVGGSATAEQVEHALRILSSDKRVRTILINIFGGIMRCDTIAEGILRALRRRNRKNRISVVVRLLGTNADMARKMLRRGRVPVIACDDLSEAAKKAVLLAKMHDLAARAGVSINVESS